MDVGKKCTQRLNILLFSEVTMISISYNDFHFVGFCQKWDVDASASLAK